LGHLALDAPRHEITIFINTTDKEMIGFGEGAQIRKYSSRALETPRHEICIRVKRN
jgi:hypothetical protein